jgi:hypothetical protein
MLLSPHTDHSKGQDTLLSHTDHIKGQNTLLSHTDHSKGQDTLLSHTDHSKGQDTLLSHTDQVRGKIRYCHIQITLPATKLCMTFSHTGFRLFNNTVLGDTFMKQNGYGW